jgi:hypothetical protein
VIVKSTFLPRIRRALMAFDGLRWLTFMVPPPARSARRDHPSRHADLLLNCRPKSG